MATRLMRLSFQTAVMPSVFTVAGAVVALATIEFNRWVPLGFWTNVEICPCPE